MASFLTGRILNSDVTYRTALRLLPIIVRLTRGNTRIARVAYRIYSVLPLNLAIPGARAAHLTANALHRHQFEAALHRTMAYRFDFDAGEHLDLWHERCDELLSLCDQAISTNLELELTADLLFEMLSVLFHPNVHQGLQPSPFIEHPQQTATLLAHPSLQLLRGHAEWAPQPVRTYADNGAGAQTGVRAARRVLVLTDTNFNFMGAILEHWKTDPNLHVRARNLSQEGVDSAWWHPRNTVVDRLTDTRPMAPAFLIDDLEWADVIYVEWGQALAARLSELSMSAKLIVRLHKYEAFIPTPTLTNWNQVDTLIIITPYMRELLNRTIPGIEARTRVELVANVVELAKFQLPKRPDARRNLALIQHGSIVKDPLWAIEVLKVLLDDDPSWQLLLIGSAADLSNADAATKQYFEEYGRRVQQVRENVRFLGHQNDLPETLRSVGVILSASQIEGAPVSLQEAVASGALPVVRDWPIVKAIDGAGNLYPADWLVQTPAEAAERIIKWAANVEGPIDEVESRLEMVEQFDAPITIQKLNHVVLEQHNESTNDGQLEK